MFAKSSHIPSPMEKTFKLLSPNDGKALRIGLYTVFCIILAGLFFVSLLSIYSVLATFVKPLVCALIVGNCIFSIKKYFMQYISSTLLPKTSTKSFLVSFMIFPIHAINNFTFHTTRLTIKHLKLLIFVLIIVPISCWIYTYGPFIKSMKVLTWTYLLMNKCLQIFSSLWMTSFIMVYLAVVALYWSQDTYFYLKILALPIWISAIVNFSNLAGIFQVPILFCLSLTILIGALGYIFENRSSILSSGQLLAICEFIMKPIDSNSFRETEKFDDINNAEKNFMSNLSDFAQSIDKSEDPTFHENKFSTVQFSNSFSISLLKKRAAKNSLVMFDSEGDIVNNSSARSVSFASDNEENPSDCNTPTNTIKSEFDTSSQPQASSSASTWYGNGNNVLSSLKQRASTGNAALQGILRRSSATASHLFADVMKSEIINRSNYSRFTNGGDDLNNENMIGESSNDGRVYQETDIDAEEETPGFVQFFDKLYATRTDSLDDEASKLLQSEVDNNLQFNRQATEAMTPSRDHVTINSSIIISGSFVFLGWSLLLVYSWRHPWVLSVIPLSFAFVALKKILHWWWEEVSRRTYVINFTTNIKAGVSERQEILTPVALQNIMKLAYQGDRKIRQFVISHMDGLVAFFTIVFVIFCMGFGFLFVMFRIQAETVQLVSMTSNVLNSTLRPDLYKWLPERDHMKGMFDSMVKNGHHYGRNWISNKANVIFGENSTNNAIIQKQILELWDKVYDRIVSQNGTIFKSKKKPLNATLVNLKSSLGDFNLTRLYKNYQSMIEPNRIFNIVKANLGLIYKVMDSLWLLLKSNVSLCFSILEASVSFILGGGTVVLSYLLSTLIFFTTLYYMLAYSDDVYMPYKLFGSEAARRSSPLLNILHQAVVSAINCVFGLTLERMAFNCLFTILTHSLFGVHLIVIPAASAACLGAVPFIGTYWACLPALLELVFLQQEYGLALAMILCHIFPSFVFEPAAYAQIRGSGHPYLTGLVLFGGIFCYGIEGAVIGPMLLCTILIVLNIYNSLMSPKFLDESHQYFTP